jgi:hypothetical protein
MSKKTRDDFPVHIQMMLRVLEGAEDCRRENNALRSILREQGLSEKAIRDKVRRLLKNPDVDEDGAQILKRVSEECIKRLQDHDAQELLAKIDPIGGVQ